jgi:hydrogenase expression/formation protein HypD
LVDVEKYYRKNEVVAREIVATIKKLAPEARKSSGNKGPIRIMNFCGTHEWTTTHYGIRSMMPADIELIAGPGCPVCITPANYVDFCINLALKGTRVYTYGDAFKLPTTRPTSRAGNLEKAKALGADVKVVYSFLDAIADAKKWGGDAVFLGIGFETTMAAYAAPIERGMLPPNLYFISALRWTPPAAEFAINRVGRVDGVIAPGHVSVITGASAWSPLAEKLGIPAVVSGFEPIDLLISIAGILRQMATGRHQVEIEYSRAVEWKGNEKVLSSVSRVFETVDSAWRGIGIIPSSGLELRDAFAHCDAKKFFSLNEPGAEASSQDLPKGCRCGEVTLGLTKPIDCPMFLSSCTPERPYGPCMVSSEGTCAVWSRFGGGGLAERVASEVGVI